MNTVKTQKTIIIIGVGRCGTSIVAGWLDIMGLFMGREYLPSDKFNIHGHFEDALIVDIHTKFLNRLSASWWRPPTDRATIYHVCKDDPNLPRMIQTIERRNKQHTIWGWKDPRTHLFIDLYKEHLINPHYIVLFRDPWAIAQSIMRRDGKDKFEAMDIVDKHSKRIQEFISEDMTPKLFVSFNTLYDNTLKTVERIRDFVGLDYDQGKLLRCVEFIVPTERHF